MPFLSHNTTMQPLTSVKTYPPPSFRIAYKFSSPTGSQTFVLLSFNARAGMAVPFAYLFKCSLASFTRFSPILSAIKYCMQQVGDDFVIYRISHPECLE